MSVSNIIEVAFGSSTLVFAEPCYKYNSGMYLKFTDLDLPTSYQVHFANSNTGDSLESIGDSDGVLIPNDVWQTGATIYAWVYLHPTEDSAVTRHEVRIPVTGRADLPDGTEPTPSEQSTIDQAITALNNAVTSCETAVEQAGEYASLYPIIQNGYWYVWNASLEEYVSTNVKAEGTDGKGIASIAKTSTVGLVDTYTITFTDGTTTTYTVTNGTNGTNGVSPTVSVSTITGGHTVSITDADGTQSFNVMDGEDGEVTQAQLTIVSDNVLDKTALTTGKYVNKKGTVGTGSSYAYTDYIKVKQGDVVKGWSGNSTSLTFRYVCAYDQYKAVVSASGAENVSSYTVPSGIEYVRITGYVRTDSTGINGVQARIVVDGVDCKYQTYKAGSVCDFSRANYTALQQLKYYPLTTLNEYILHNLAYKPLCSLSKGYVCFVSDDGNKELATYTIPMFEEKNAPLTMAVMSSSEVFTDADNAETYTATVVDAVTNHGCEIAQHGGSSWKNSTENTLNLFFDSEEEFFATLGLTPYGAVCPQHDINDLVRAVAGGRFGCVRTGYANAVQYYPNYTNGPRSNLFGLCSQSAVDGTLASQKTILDYVKENHLLRIIHFHEYELDADAKTQLEGIIDYVQEIGLEIITMKDIPTII